MRVGLIGFDSILSFKLEDLGDGFNAAVSFYQVQSFFDSPLSRISCCTVGGIYPERTREQCHLS